MKQLHTPTAFEKSKAIVLLTLTTTWTFLPSVSLLANNNGLVVNEVVAGDVIHETIGNTTNVYLNESRNIVDYHEYNVWEGESVSYLTDLSGPTSILSEVTGGSITEIHERIISQENIEVVLANPAGIFFGKNAYVNTGALLAIAGNIASDDYLAGLNNFSNLTGSVENYGTIKTKGIAALVGKTVANYGTIISRQSNVFLVAGEQVLLGERNGHVYVDLSSFSATNDTRVENSGNIEAKDTVLLAAGDALGMAILHSGLIESRSTRLNGEGLGDVEVAGVIEATDSVQVTGENVLLQDGARISASNENGGGEILIGGDREGLNSDVRNADNVFVGEDVTLSADAKISGEGGKLVVYANEKAIILGTLSALGAADADGGFVETSGKEYLVVAKSPEIGPGGEWLIDPNNIEIVADGALDPDNSINVNESSPFETTGDGAQIEVGLIVAALTGGTDVSMTTSSGGSEDGDITLTADLNYDGTGTNSLTFNAANDIFINGSITDSTAGGDNLNLVLNADTDNSGAGSTTISNTVDLSGGDLTVTGQAFALEGTLTADTLDTSVVVSGSTIELDNIVSLTAFAGNGSETIAGSDSVDENFELSSLEENAGNVGSLAFTGVGAIDAGTSAGDSVTGSSGSETFELNGAEDGTVRGIMFSEVESIVSSDGGDTYNVNADMTRDLDLGVGGDTVTVADNVTLTGSVNGNTGNDTVVLVGGTNGSELTGDFNGNAGDDILTIGTGSSVGGTFDGGDSAGDNDALSYAGNTDSVSVSIDGSGATGLTSGFSNVETVIGNDSVDASSATTLVGTSGNDILNLNTDANSGNVDSGIAFENVTAIEAAGGADEFNIDIATEINLAGEAGEDTFNLNADPASALAGGVDSDTFNVNADVTEDFLLSEGGDIVNLANGVAVTGSVTGGTGNDSVILGESSSLTGSFTGNAGDDTLTVGTDASVGGSFAGGAATNGDTLSYAGNTTDGIEVDIDGTSATGLTGGFSGVETLIGNDSVDATSSTTLVGTSGDDTFDLNTDPNSGDVTGGITLAFQDVTAIEAGDGADDFNINTETAINLFGEGGTDDFNINADASGTLSGGADSDTFIIADGVDFTGTVDGGASLDVLQVNIDGADAALTSLAANGYSGEIIAASNGNFVGIEALNFTSGENTLTGLDQNAYWDLETLEYSASDGAVSISDLPDTVANPDGLVLEFDGFEILEGGSLQDWFNISVDVVAQLLGGDGDDIFFFEGIADDAASPVLTSSLDGVSAIDGGLGTDVLAGGLSLTNTTFGAPNISERIILSNAPGTNEFINIELFKKVGGAFDASAFGFGVVTGEDTIQFFIDDPFVNGFSDAADGTAPAGADTVFAGEDGITFYTIADLVNPLSIIGNNGSDELVLGSNNTFTSNTVFGTSPIAASFTSNLYFDGAGGDDTVTFRGNFDITGDGSLTLIAETIDMSTAGTTFTEVPVFDNGDPPMQVGTEIQETVGSTVDYNVTTTSGDITISTDSFTQSGNLASASGSIDVSTGTSTFTQNGTISSTSGDIGVDAGTFNQNSTLSSTDGDININTTGTYNQEAVVSSTNGSVNINVASGNFNQRASIIAGGAATVAAAVGDIVMFDFGTAITTSGSTIDYTAGDDVFLDTLQSSSTVNVVSSNGGIYDVSFAEAANITGTDVTLSAAEGVGTIDFIGGANDRDINVAVDTLTVTNDSGGIDVNEADGLILSGAETTNGTIEILVDDGNLGIGGAVVANTSGNVILEVNNSDNSGSDGIVQINANVSSASGNSVSITGGSVTQNVDISTGGTLSITAESADIEMAEGTTTTTSAGDINYTANSGSIALEQLTATSGNINVKAGTNALTIDDSITAGGDITLEAENGEVVLNDNGNVNSNYISTVSGNVTITGGSIAQNDDISTTGTVAVTADNGSTTMADGTETQGSAISYTATDDVLLSVLNSSGTVTVTADSDSNAVGAISDNLTSEDANVIAAAATLTAATGIGVDSAADIDTDVDTLTATNSTSGSIVIDEMDDLGLVAVTNTGRAVKLTAGGAITDSDSTENTDIDIEGSTVELTAGGAIGASDSLLDVSVTTMLDANTGSSNGGIYIDGGSTGLPLGAINAGSGTVILSSDTNITDATIDEGTANLTAGNATLLATLGIGGAGDADIDTEVTSLSLNNSSSGDIVVSDTDETDSAGFSATNSSGNIDFTDAGDIALGAVDAGANNVTLDSGGSITDGNGSATNVTADSAVLTAVENIGSGNDTESDINDAAIDITVTSIEAQAGADVYLESSQAVTIGGASDALAGLTGGTDESGQGVVKLKSAGTITVDEAVVADTDILLLTTAGDIDQNVNGLLTATTGNATVIAADNFNQDANITAGNDAYVEATSGAITMGAATQANADNIRYAAGTNVALSLLAATDSVSVTAGGSIIDTNSDEATNISGARARLVAGGSIGTAGTTANSDMNVNAVDISVANVEAQATSDIYLQSNQAVIVGDVGDVETVYERFDSGNTTETDLNLVGLSNSDLSLLADVKLKSANTITVNEIVEASQDVLLLTTSGDIDQEANVIAARDLTFVAADNVNQDADIEASWVYVEAEGGNIMMTSGTQTGAANNIRYISDADAALGLLSASDSVSVKAGADITDANSDATTNVSGSRARLEAGASIGSNADTGAVDISVSNVEALAGTNVYLNSNQAVTVGGVSDIGTYRQYFDGDFEFLEDTNLVGIQGAVGEVFLESAGGITISEVVDAGADLTLETTSGDITQNVAIDTTADINLIAADNVYQNADINTTGGAVTVNSQAGEVLMGSETETTSNGNDISYTAEGTSGNVTLTVLDAGVGDVAVTAGAAIVDGLADTDEADGEQGVNILGATATLSAETGIGSSADDIDTTIITLAATNTADGDIYIEETNDLVLDEVMNTMDNGASGFGVVSLAVNGGAITDGNGSAVNVVAETAILNADSGIGDNGAATDAIETTVDALFVENSSSNEIYIEETDSVALETLSNADRAVSLTAGGAITDGGDDNIDIVAGTLTINAVNGIGDDGITADGIEVTASTLSAENSASNSIRIEETDDIALDTLSNGDRAVFLTAGGTIADGGDDNMDVAAGMATLIAQNIGSSGGTADDNPSAIDIAVGAIEARADDNIYLESNQAVTIGGTSDDTTGLESANGVVKLKSAGTITVAEEVTAGSDILLWSTAGDILQNAMLTTTRGNVSLRALNDVMQNANISTGGDSFNPEDDIIDGTVDVEATEGSITMAAGTVTGSNGSNILYVADTDVILGLLNAGNGDVSVDAGGDITEAEAGEAVPEPYQIDPSGFSSYSDQVTFNIIANSVRLKAGGSIGEGTNNTFTSPNAGGNPGVPDLKTPSSGSLDVYASNLSSESGQGSEDNTFIFGSGDVVVIDNFENEESVFTVDDLGIAISVNRVNFDSSVIQESDTVLDRVGFAGGDYTIASGGAIFFNNSLNPTADGVDISSGGEQNFLFGLDSGEVNNAIIRFLADYSLNAGGAIFMTSNRSETKPADIFDSNLLSPTTIISEKFNLSIEADGDFVMGQFEKLSIGSDSDNISDAANSTSGNLSITAENMFVGDISVQGDFALDTNTLNIIERLPEVDIFGDDEEEGADIAVVGLLDFMRLSVVQGTAGGSIQEVIPLGGGDLGDITPISRNNVQYGNLANLEELFQFGPDFDNISQPVTSLQFFPFVENPQIFEVEPPVENVPEALREELLKLRIFARDLTEEEQEERRKKGYMYATQMIVDEFAPISAYEVAVSRISTEFAQQAIDLYKDLLGEEGENVETISEVISGAYREYIEFNQDGTPEEFAQYLLTPETELPEEAFGYVDSLNLLFEKIGSMGVTETELSISRRNILSRLKVDGLRGRDMIEFFDSFVLAKETGLSLPLN